MFPQAQQMNGYTLVPHEPISTFMLRKVGYDVPSPILTQYVWPHPQGQPPFDAQMKTAAMLTMHSNAYCLNSMGTGKTRSALWAWDFLNNNNMAKKLLVVAPLSTLKFTWAREIFATLPHRKYTVLYGTKAKRLEALKSDADIFIINHDGMRTITPELNNHPDIDTLIIDELAVYRNGQALRTKAMRKEAARFTWVWGMTGSPIPNVATDAWAQASIVTPNTVPKYFKHFREDLMVRVSQFKWAPKPDAVHKAFAALQPSVRFTLDDIMELPEAVYRTVDIELGPLQSKIYKQMAAHCYAAVQSGEISAANAGACMNKLMQVSTGYVYADKDEQGKRKVATLDNEARISALIDMVLSGDGKKLVFVPFKHALAGIGTALKNEGIDYASVSGDTSANERGEIFNLFQNTSKYSVLAAHPQCLAHGLTLTMADTIIWFSPTTSLEIYDQANMRIRRVGQKHKQLYMHFQGTPVEKRIYQLLRNKQNIQGELLDLFEVATQELTI
jgi:SNF2 family DNA or RNA helicase